MPAKKKVRDDQPPFLPSKGALKTASGFITEKDNFFRFAQHVDLLNAVLITGAEERGAVNWEALAYALSSLGWDEPNEVGPELAKAMKDSQERYKAEEDARQAASATT